MGSEVTFAGVVTSAPHFFYGTRTHAIHESFDVRGDGEGWVHQHDARLDDRLKTIVDLRRVMARGRNTRKQQTEKIR